MVSAVNIRSLITAEIVPFYEGNIVQLTVFNKSIIVLNDALDARNILDKRGYNYSDRARAVLQGEL